MARFPFTFTTLDNCLRVVISPDHTTPSATVMVWYDVGSRDEVAGKTGFAHLFEHLMFRGSKNVKGGEFDAIMDSVGGAPNGATSFDMTVYFEGVPANAIGTALWLEADRMGSLFETLDQTAMDAERDVVKNERRQSYDNQPYGRMHEELITTIIPGGHAYDHLPIGSMEDLQAASVEDALAFWRQWYGPNNAVLSIVGDVDPAETLAEVEKYFGSIPRIPTPPATDAAVLPPVPSQVRRELRESVPAERFLSAWRTPPAGTEESDALGVAAAILATGDASRLKMRLIEETQLAATVSAGDLDMALGTSVFTIVANARDGASLADVETAVLAELESLATAGPSEAELSRAKAQLERQLLQGLGGQLERTWTFCQMVAHYGDAGRINSLVDRALAPTAEQVRAAVATYLTSENRVVINYVLEAAT